MLTGIAEPCRGRLLLHHTEHAREVVAAAKDVLMSSALGLFHHQVVSGLVFAVQRGGWTQAAGRRCPSSTPMTDAVCCTAATHPGLDCDARLTGLRVPPPPQLLPHQELLDKDAEHGPLHMTSAATAMALSATRALPVVSPCHAGRPQRTKVEK